MNWKGLAEKRFELRLRKYSNISLEELRTLRKKSGLLGWGWGLNLGPFDPLDRGDWTRHFVLMLYDLCL
jgi:hypothetical protein